MLIAGHSDGGV
jgi:hypothetical protein